jgi:hypothetical protein
MEATELYTKLVMSAKAGLLVFTQQRQLAAVMVGAVMKAVLLVAPMVALVVAVPKQALVQVTRGAPVFLDKVMPEEILFPLTVVAVAVHQKLDEMMITAGAAMAFSGHQVLEPTMQAAVEAGLIALQQEVMEAQAVAVAVEIQLKLVLRQLLIQAAAVAAVGTIDTVVVEGLGLFN